MSEYPETNPEIQENENIKPGKFALSFFFFGGVLLPVAALFGELISRICAENLFDPIPTWWHVLMVAFVPITNFETLLAFRRGYTTRPGWLSFANGVAIFICLFYSLIFAPVVPIAVLAILLFLLGFLPLAPIFSLIAGIIMRIRMRRLAPVAASRWMQWKALAAAFLFVTVVVGIAELSFTITRMGIAKANSSDARTQAEGVAMLRKYGDRDLLLRMSYDGSAVASTALFFKLLYRQDDDWERDRSAAVQAQNAWYRLTGKSYRQEQIPRGVRHWDRIDAWGTLDPTQTFRLDPGLSLSVSQLDGSIDADAALGYIEWTLVFKNEHMVSREALAQVQLPPGAVVSRLTLWINGEEREAAFAKSAKVIEAYDRVTATRRDPALVTVTGRDRVQLKCFPVPAGGEMKVRLGITVPVVLESATAGYVAMPYFQDRNFVVSARHSVWVESARKLESANPAFRHEQTEKLSGVRGQLGDDEFTQGALPIKVTRSEDVRTAWTTDKLNRGRRVVQEIKEVAKGPAKRMILVVDASTHLAASQDQIGESLRKLPDDTPVVLILSSGNGLNGEIAAPNSFEGTPGQAADRVASARFEGGTDAVSAIEKAWETAQSSSPGSAIVWIHGPQPVEIDSPARLTQLWTRRPTEVPIYSLQIGAGRNPIERALNESDAVLTVIRHGDPGEDLTRLFDDLRVSVSRFEAVRTIGTTSVPTAAISKETSQHLVRLWANDETLRLLKAGNEAAAIETAVANQLVTRVSGAVVLENQQQYDQFGLKPVDANSVPTIPEPEDYLLFGVLVLVLLYFIRRYRSHRHRPAAAYES